jgi:opacity protein-like surface antigen
VEFDETSPGSGNGFEAGLFYTNEKDDDVAAAISGEVEVTTYEFYGGVRHTFRPGQGGLHPFVSAGIDLEHGRIKLTAPGVSEADGDLVVGAYARAGLLWDITERVRLGVDYRYLLAQDFDIFDTDLGTDYDQVTFSLGFAF